MRSRLSELYRGCELTPTAPCRTPTRWSCSSCPRTARATGSTPTQFSRSLRLARLGETARTVFAGAETIGRLGDHRVLVLAERDDRLGRRTSLLRTMLLPGAVRPPGVWIEGLPATDDAAAILLDELARG